MRAILLVGAFCLVGYCAAQNVGVVDPELDMEQRERAALAEELFAPISFNLGNYFYVQEDLKRYISEFTVNDPQWTELKKLHASKDYLGMIGVLKKEKLREYPPKNEIKRFHSLLMGEVFGGCHFKLSISLTHKINVVLRAFPGKKTGVMLGQDFQNVTWTFKIPGGKCFYIYSPDDKINVIIKRYGDACDKVREDMKMARIFKEEGEAKIAALCDQQFNTTIKWLASSKVMAGDFINGRKPLPNSFWKQFAMSAKEEPIAGAKVDGAEEDKPEGLSAGVRCPDCDGKKFITEKTCDKCDGAGYVVRSTRITDLSGNKIPDKKAKCPNCKGKGKVYIGRKKCESCKGTGLLTE